MAVLSLIQAEGLLLCLFAICQEVSSRWEDCWGNGCFGASPLPTSAIIMFSLLGSLFGGICLLILWACCLKVCRSSRVSSPPEEPATNLPVPPPIFALPVLPSAPSQNLFEKPPPYTEVPWNPFYYPPPLDLPPAYDNIAMEVVPSVDVPRPPESAPKDNF